MLSCIKKGGASGGIDPSKVQTGELAKITVSDYEVWLVVPSGVIPLRVGYYLHTRNGDLITDRHFSITLYYKDSTTLVINDVVAQSGQGGTWNEITSSAYLGYDINSLRNINMIVLTSRIGYQFSNQSIWISEWIEE